MHHAVLVLLLTLSQTLVSSHIPSDTNTIPAYRKLRPRSLPSEPTTSRTPKALSNSVVKNSDLNIHQDLNTTTHDDPHLLCQSRPLTPSLWKKLDMNSYLDNYPNGTALNLEDYASRVGGLDFQCGIGRICNPGQLCESIYGRDWYALVATQNWNNFVNMLYQAIGDAFDSAAGINISRFQPMSPKT
ncbi:hypothetical protein PSTG_14612 [Puccinia striiformis f. sp. tritici PST-78]|uniref:Uncharacterized protein n=1 Tax=Puccinia striiformis f. sp. tritici PST-78 TaxID=1165861 RepID=A0A0L0UYA4_9BASI|nr:hypothetical protein PSTG_14610 [Puccinia striiformis f. sp. tritici PST-78]KNE91987.1 hypothetical protein PSTG_14612 [Puccinia striiformis f. sp. tritici PST-78]